MGDKSVTRIRCAALRIAGKVYEGKRHSDIILAAVRSGSKLRPYPNGDDFGFITDTGMFVNRERALKIALEAGQVKEGMTLSRDELHSEDIL